MSARLRWEQPRGTGEWSDDDDAGLREVHATAFGDARAEVEAAARGRARDDECGSGVGEGVGEREGSGGGSDDDDDGSDELDGGGGADDGDDDDDDLPRTRAQALRERRLGPMSVEQKRAAAYGSFSLLSKVDMLQDSRNLRFREIFHAPDTWVNMIALVVMLTIVVLGASETWPFHRAVPRV